MRDSPTSESKVVSRVIERNLPLVLYPTPSHPARDSERIVPLDALRGFALYVERVGQIATVFAIWAFQLAISPVWLRYFHFGPAEWL